MYDVLPLLRIFITNIWQPHSADITYMYNLGLYLLYRNFLAPWCCHRPKNPIWVRKNETKMLRHWQILTSTKLSFPSVNTKSLGLVVRHTIYILEYIQVLSLYSNYANKLRCCRCIRLTVICRCNLLTLSLTPLSQQLQLSGQISCSCTRTHIQTCPSCFSFVF